MKAATTKKKAGTVKAAAKPASVIKFRHPENPAIGWTGHGRKPQWVIDWLAQGKPLAPFFNDTDIFIFPGYEFQVVDAMVTNFHLPESTLIMLVSAFAGYDNVMAAYQAAVAEQYRFFSYGDAMFVTRRQVEA